MTPREAIARLEEMGTAQNRKVYPRHGVSGPLFGVSYANLRALAKEIRTDQALAQALWESGNHDARVLATMVADPAALSRRELDAWARDIDNYILADAVSGLVARSPHAKDRMARWTAAKGEWVERVGWTALARLAMEDGGFADGELDAYLETIEAEVHGRKNRVRDAMMNALIAIGSRDPELRDRALAAAARIGEVEVDHGATGCKTPDPIPYIRKVWQRREKAPGRKSRAAT